MKIILEGIVGSKAYGLDHKDSDTDIKGIFIYPTEQMLSLAKGTQTIVESADKEYHEVEKFIILALQCNPTILELLYLNEYTILTEEGKWLIENKKYFLSKQILKTYGGYALAQAKKLYLKGQDFIRYAKHARHCFRLLMQGTELLETGSLTIKLNGLQINYLNYISKQEPTELLKLFEKGFKQFEEVKTELPETPNRDRINNLLLEIRKINYGL